MPKSKQTSVSSGTREALILAGERLFAENGINGISLRQINTAAGQKNSSAAHYHFGSKDALVAAIHSYRIEHVNERRNALLETLMSSGDRNSTREVVETIVYPIVEEIHETHGGSHYIRFLAQLIGHPQIKINYLWKTDAASGLMRAMDLLIAANPEVPGPIMRQRIGFMWEQAIHALSDREKLRKFAEGGEEAELVVFISNLVDTIAGGLAAPVSDTTRRELKAAGINRESGQ
jgi:AcrR family transcriptional regulator